MKYLRTVFDLLRRLFANKDYGNAGIMLATIEAYVDGDSLFDAGLFYDGILAAIDDPVFIKEFNKRSGASLKVGFLDDGEWDQPEYGGWEDSDSQKASGIFYGMVLEKGFAQESADEIVEFVENYLCTDDDEGEDEVRLTIMEKYKELGGTTL